MLKSILALIALSLVAQAAESPTHLWRLLEGESSEAVALNKNGQVVVLVEFPMITRIDGVDQPTIGEYAGVWNLSDDSFTRLAEVPGYPGSQGACIMDSGEVAGTVSRAEVPHNRAIFWSNKDGPTTLPPFGEDWSAKVVTCTNDYIIGSSFGEGERPVIWERDGASWKVSELGRTRDVATPVGISPNGKYIVGVDGGAAVMWTRSDSGWTSEVVDPSGTARAVNNSGIVAGDIFDRRVIGRARTVVREAFIWSKAGGRKLLGFLGNDVESRALGITEQNQIIGNSSNLKHRNAFIWDAARGMRGISIQGAFTIFSSLGANGTVVGALDEGSDRRAMQATFAALK